MNTIRDTLAFCWAVPCLCAWAALAFVGLVLVASILVLAVPLYLLTKPAYWLMSPDRKARVRERRRKHAVHRS